jgi:uncharacterized membrane protein YhaH (DUF805 family)
VGDIFSFDGRVGRKTYWLWSFLIFAVLFVAIMIVGGAVSLTADPTTNEVSDGGVALAGTTFFIAYIVATVASLSTQVKRWHDRGKSGWWALIGFVPYVGSLWVLVECGFLAGTPGPNQYGQQP